MIAVVTLFSQCGKLVTVIGHQFTTMINHALRTIPCTAWWARGTASRGSVSGSEDLFVQLCSSWHFIWHSTSRRPSATAELSRTRPQTHADSAWMAGVDHGLSSAVSRLSRLHQWTGGHTWWTKFYDLFSHFYTDCVCDGQCRHTDTNCTVAFTHRGTSAISMCKRCITTVPYQLSLYLKKRPTFKLSVTLSNLNRFSNFCSAARKAYEICYKTHTALSTSP